MQNLFLEIAQEQPTLVQTVSISEKGPVRRRNEDSIAVVNLADRGCPEKGTMLVVADGMGGMAAGDRASAIVTEDLPVIYMESECANVVTSLVQALVEVNRRVFAAGERVPGGKGMGTTVVVSVLTEQSVITANVGDSRAYLFRNGRITQLSEDHSLRREFSNPFETGGRDFSHVLTQAIGPQRNVTPHVNVTRVHENDLILLCSDGLTSVVPDSEIEDILSRFPFSQTASALLARAIESASDDNVSIIVSRIHRIPAVEGAGHAVML